MRMAVSGADFPRAGISGKHQNVGTSDLDEKALTLACR
jgi:hypothetical protein